MNQNPALIVIVAILDFVFALWDQQWKTLAHRVKKWMGAPDAKLNSSLLVVVVGRGKLQAGPETLQKNGFGSKLLHGKILGLARRPLTMTGRNIESGFRRPRLTLFSWKVFGRDLKLKSRFGNGVYHRGLISIHI